MWLNMKTNLITKDYNEKSKDEISSEITNSISQIKDFFILFSSENTDLNTISSDEFFQNLYILSRIVINRPIYQIDVSYQLMSELFEDGFNLDDFKVKFDYFQNNSNHLRTLHQNLLKLSQILPHFRELIYNLILGLISVDINLNEKIINELDSIFDYHDLDFNLKEYEILVDRYSFDSKLKLFDEVIENLFFQYQKVDSFQINYLNSFIRFSIILLYIVSGDFNDFDKKHLNKVLNSLNLIEIDDEIEEYYSKKIIENIFDLYLDNRSQRMIENLKNYFKITNNYIFDVSFIKTLILAINIKGFITSQQEIFIEFMSKKIGGKNGL
jgi:hypothetical protein